MAAKSFTEVKKHFESKGLYVGLSADRYGWIHTLDVYRVPPGHPQFLKQGGMFSLAINRKGEISLEHLIETVSRYAAGLPRIHPHTGKIDA